MRNERLFVRYRSYENTITFSDKIGSSIINQFAGAVNVMKKNNKHKYTPLRFDFTAVQHPYSNGMLPIIAIVNSLRSEGYKIIIRLPNSRTVMELFLRTNWAHYLDPDNYKVNATYDRHLHTRCFKDDKDVADLTNDFMDVVLRSMFIPKDIVSALEWSIYEICDNVINHSDSKLGGFIEAVAFSKEEKIQFTVADAGRGILNSLQEGIPGLKTSTEAILEAIKDGVTRNKEKGQGNGLAGSQRITLMTGGSIDITSGTGRIYQTSNHPNQNEYDSSLFFQGTSVSGSILMNKGFSINKALVFNGVEYFPSNIIEIKYEHDTKDMFIVKLKEESSGVGTRKAGKQINTKVINLLNSNPSFPIYIDWTGISLISSSFADEFIGKLYWEIGQNKFISKIHNINTSLLVKQLLDKAISQRING